MVNPSNMQRLGRDHERDLLAVAPYRASSRGGRVGVRQRLGRTLISLGVRLAGDPRSGRQARLQPARGGVSRARSVQAVRPVRPLVRS